MTNKKSCLTGVVSTQTRMKPKHKRKIITLFMKVRDTYLATVFFERLKRCGSVKDGQYLEKWMQITGRICRYGEANQSDGSKSKGF